MPIIRHKHKADYLVVPNDIFRNERLSLRDVGLLCYMLFLPDGWDFSINGLNAQLKADGRDAISKSLRSLEESGYLRRTTQKVKGGKFGGCVWEISDLPELVSPKTDLPYTDKPCSDSPDAVSPCTANPGQYKYPRNLIPKNTSTHKERMAAEPPTRHQYGQYKNVLLSDSDLEKLKQEFQDWEARIDRLSEYMESTGKKYKNHLATIRSWARKDSATSKPSRDRSKNTLDMTKTDLDGLF